MLQSPLVDILALRVARRHAFGKDGDAHFMTLAGQARHGAAAAENLIVWMCSDNQDAHGLGSLAFGALAFCSSLCARPASRVILTSATIRPSYSAERLNSKRKPA